VSNRGRTVHKRPSARPIGLSGGQPGTPSADNTTGSHLHLGVRFAGATVSPQPLLLAIYRANPVKPAITPAVGCMQCRSTTGSRRWLAQIAPKVPLQLDAAVADGATEGP